MNKNEVKKLFWNIVNQIEDCCDIITQNDQGVVIEKGMGLSNNCSITFGLDDGVLRIYNAKYSPVASFTEEDETLIILKDLFEYLIEESTAPEVPVQEQYKDNFSTITGEKLSNTCPNCWVKGYKPYNCGFEKCPGYKLFTLEKSKT